MKKKGKLMEMLFDDVKIYFEYKKRKKERKELLFLKYIQNVIN